MDKAMLWGFCVAMYIVVGLQWSGLFDRTDPAGAAFFGDTDQGALRRENSRKLVRGVIFAAGLAAIVIRHFALLR